MDDDDDDDEENDGWKILKPDIILFETTIGLVYQNKKILIGFYYLYTSQME